jgi:hypothetical protein
VLAECPIVFAKRPLRRVLARPGLFVALRSTPTSMRRGLCRMLAGLGPFAALRSAPTSMRRGLRKGWVRGPGGGERRPFSLPIGVRSWVVGLGGRWPPRGWVIMAGATVGGNPVRTRPVTGATAVRSMAVARVVVDLVVRCFAECPSILVRRLVQRMLSGPGPYVALRSAPACMRRGLARPWVVALRLWVVGWG